MGRYRLRIAKTEHKFSAAHMTVFADGSKERLHGHNFQMELRLRVTDVATAQMCDFGVIKQVVRELCGELNERMLVAQNNRHLRVTVEPAPEGDTTPDGAKVRLSHPSGEYLLPRADVVLLPLENITSEQLARWAHGELSRRLRALPGLPPVVESLEVGIVETQGQGGFYDAPLDNPRS